MKLALAVLLAVIGFIVVMRWDSSISLNPNNPIENQRKLDYEYSVAKLILTNCGDDKSDLCVLSHLVEVKYRLGYLRDGKDKDLIAWRKLVRWGRLTNAQKPSRQRRSPSPTVL